MPPQLVRSCVSSSLCISLLIPPWLDWERIWWAPFPGLPQGPLETMDQDRDRDVVWTSVGCRSCHGVMFLMWHTIQVFVDSTPIGTYAFFHITGVKLFFQGVHCFLFSSHSFEFYFQLSFLFSCFQVGLVATQFLEAFRVHYPPHPLPVSLSLAKFKFIIFGQGPNSGFF